MYGTDMMIIFIAMNHLFASIQMVSVIMKRTVHMETTKFSVNLIFLIVMLTAPVFYRTLDW